MKPLLRVEYRAYVEHVPADLPDGDPCPWEHLGAFPSLEQAQQAAERAATDLILPVGLVYAYAFTDDPYDEQEGEEVGFWQWKPGGEWEDAI